MSPALTAQADPATGAPDPAIHPRGVLYKVSSGSHVLYLFGTIHVGNSDFYPLEPRLMAVLDKATTLALELDPFNAGAMQSALQRYGMYPAGQSYANDLDPRTRQQLQSLLKHYGIPASSVATMRPWMLATVVTLGESAAQGYTSDFAVDSYLASWSKQRGKKIIELESADRQLALLGNLSPAQQLRFLRDTMDELNSADGRRQIREIVQAWNLSDRPMMERLLQEMTLDPGYASQFTRKVLLDQRNPGLAEGIAALLRKESNSVAAIGVLHLIGDGNVALRLQQQGYAVEQIY
ncbi:TraB/GumN family protein [Herbaspirillum sp. RTI4]|uniref:TraB/GumN family protein n=1 Tax=Herbaspirillum sp. RTI4 TaxID=3048640 RepID=UPI002AB51B6D|nr:TraB/GumN family protein [Herbaspirillum sp. RTI4]MDY7576933.1 TraB/GumN family protein [Herbaspirillum sp. RTI4]MEA9983196.1 TraB/GumN family protein [Herbaspirillum sp. RTI4]